MSRRGFHMWHREATRAKLFSVLLLGILPHLSYASDGMSGSVSGALLPLKSDVPMGHDTSSLPTGFWIRKYIPPTVGKVIGGTFRLPESISPIHYDLEIRPIIDNDVNEEQYAVPGTVTIRIRCLSATSVIILHAKWMEIYYFKITVVPVGTSPPVRMTGFNHDKDDDRQIFTIFLNSDLIINEEYLLTIPFKSVIASEDERQTAIYRSSYMGSDGKWKTLVSTHFQKPHARGAFPCFDEPSRLFKATFSLKIGRKLNYQSYSNTERVGEPEPISNRTGWVWDVYGKTMKLPVYSVAFALASDYAAEESPKGIYRVPIRTLVPRNLLTNTSTQFSVQASANILKFLEELLDVELPLPKMENLAMPMYEWGMEHAGLVTYRPVLLLWDADENSQFQKWDSAWMLAHEYAHMWFGNIVTCEWWNDFWLNEGFSRYFQYIVPSKVIGEDFRPASRFVLDIVQWAMLHDIGPETMPVHRTDYKQLVVAPTEIDYEKAAALIRMMETFLTTKTFFNALRVYLKRHKFGTAVQDDLFQALTEQAKAEGIFIPYPVKEIMTTWMNTKGFPVIRVSRADNDTIYISQHKFIYHPIYHNVNSSLRYVPIWYITKSEPKFEANATVPQFWMEKDTIISYFSVNNTNEWIVVNPGARGYYRVIYDSHLTKLIFDQLETDHTVFDGSTRSQLIDDFFTAAQARYIPLRTAMDITKYLQKEDELIVWTTVFENMRSLYSRLIDTKIMAQFRKYLLSLILPRLKRLGLDQPAHDSPSNIMLRDQLLDWACALKHDICIQYAKEKFAKWMSNPGGVNPIPTDYQPQIYCAAVACCFNEPMRHFLIDHYKKTKSWRQKNLVIKSLACEQTEDFLNVLLNKIIDKDDQEIDIPRHGELLLESLVLSAFGRNKTWNFIKENHRKITEIHGIYTIPWILNTLVQYASSRGVSKLDNEVTSFIANYTSRSNADSQTSLQKSAHKIVENSYWMEYYFVDLREWLMLHLKS